MPQGAYAATMPTVPPRKPAWQELRDRGMQGTGSRAGNVRALASVNKPPGFEVGVGQPQPGFPNPEYSFTPRGPATPGMPNWMTSIGGGQTKPMALGGIDSAIQGLRQQLGIPDGAPSPPPLGASASGPRQITGPRPALPNEPVQGGVSGLDAAGANPGNPFLELLRQRLGALGGGAGVAAGRLPGAPGNPIPQAERFTGGAYSF